MDVNNLGVWAAEGAIHGWEGLFDGIGLGGSLYQGTTSTTHPWIAFDLKQITRINTITLINRDSGHLTSIHRLQNIQVRIGNDEIPANHPANAYFETNEICATYAGPAEEGEYVELKMKECPIPEGQYLSIQIHCVNLGSACVFHVHEIIF